MVRSATAVVRVLYASRQALRPLCRPCRGLLESCTLGVRAVAILRVWCGFTLQQEDSKVTRICLIILCPIISEPLQNRTLRRILGKIIFDVKHSKEPNAIVRL